MNGADCAANIWRELFELSVVSGFILHRQEEGLSKHRLSESIVVGVEVVSFGDVVAFPNGYEPVRGVRLRQAMRGHNSVIRRIAWSPDW